MCRGAAHVHPEARQAVADLMLDLCRALDPEHPERVVVGPADFGCEVATDNDLSSGDLSAHATPVASVDVGPERTP